PRPRCAAHPPDPGERLPADPAAAAARLSRPAGRPRHAGRYRMRLRLARIPGPDPPMAACPQSLRRPIMALSGIEGISLPVSDQDAAKKFYAETLGFTVAMDTTFGHDGLRWVMLRPPGGGSAITRVTWFDTMSPGSQRGTVLGCDDIEHTAADLRARGLSFFE